MIPFHSVSPLSGSPIALESYSHQSIKRRALEEEIQSNLFVARVQWSLHLLLRGSTAVCLWSPRRPEGGEISKIPPP